MEPTRPMADSPVEGQLPSLSGATSWLNSPPLTPADLHGHAVLVDFWTYTCINWLRTLPYLRAWAEKSARRGYRPHLRDHLPRSRRPRLRLHLRLGRGQVDSWLTDFLTALSAILELADGPSYGRA